MHRRLSRQRITVAEFAALTMLAVGYMKRFCFFRLLITVLTKYGLFTVTESDSETVWMR